MRIFLKRERTHSIDTDLQGKVLDPVKMIERGRGGKQLPGNPHIRTDSIPQETPGALVQAAVVPRGQSAPLGSVNEQ